MPKSAGYVKPEYLKKVAEKARLQKERSYELMEIEPGNTLLDLGCGPAIDTLLLSRITGEEGIVYGVDMDEEMIALAREETASAKLEGRVFYETASAEKLPFKDKMFDACRAERLFQVIPREVSRGCIFTEILRVLKPGGRLVLSDTDWATASIDFPDPRLERTLLTYFASRLRPDGFAGRRFYRQFTEQGLKDVSVEVIPNVLMDLTETPFITMLAGSAREEGVVTAKEVDYWQEILNHRQEEGTFFSCVNTVLISGKKR